MEEGCLGDLFDVFVEGEGLVKYDALVPDVRGGLNWKAVYVEGEVMDRCGELFWSNDYYLRFIAVEFQEVELEPGFYFSDAVCQDEVGSSGDGLGGDEKLDVVGKTVELKSMTAD